MTPALRRPLTRVARVEGFCRFLTRLEPFFGSHPTHTQMHAGAGLIVFLSNDPWIGCDANFDLRQPSIRRSDGYLPKRANGSQYPL